MEENLGGQWWWSRAVQLKMHGLSQQKDNQSLARWHKNAEEDLEEKNNGLVGHKRQAIRSMRMRKEGNWHQTKTKTRETGNKGQREQEREQRKFKYNECGKTRSGRDKMRRIQENDNENEKGFAVGMRQIEIGWGKHIQEAVLRERKIQLFPAVLRFP